MSDPKRGAKPDADDITDEEAAGLPPEAGEEDILDDESVDEGDDEGIDDGDDGTETDDVARETAKDNAERREAAAALISPDMPPAGAGVMLEGDRRLDDKSETEKTLERGD